MTVEEAAPRLTLDALEAFIHGPAPGRNGQASDLSGAVRTAQAQRVVSNALLDAASVRAVFDPFALKPFGPLPDGEREAALQRLIAAGEPLAAGSGDRPRWTLKLLERRAALRRLGTRERMWQALAANHSASPSVLQRMFESLVAAKLPSLAGAPRDEIAALITACGWLEGILDELPSMPALERALARADVFAPLHRLVAGGFFGRVVERQRMRTYFEAPTDYSPPMFVHGPGGIGKSTLLARSILDQAGTVCAYVDIDRPNVRPELPLTFLLEVVRQLKVQLPHFASERLETLITDDLNKGEEGRHLESVASSQGWDFHVAEFGRLVEDTGGGRIIVAIDTFEEAQFLGDDVVEPALDFVFRLSNVAGALRVVISGRALSRAYLQRLLPSSTAIAPEQDDDEIVAALPVERRPIVLGDLTDEDARTLLQKAVGESGAAPLTPAEAAEVIGIVGRNPMSLRLAARILSGGGLVRLRENAGEFLLELKAEKIQAMLYGRILHHVHMEDVAKVAYPGLVVRRITPHIVRQVLAEPCGLTLTPERDEFAIWRDLAREAALVQFDKRDYSLRHRTDIRRVMLQDLLDHVEPDIVAAIDEAAVAYYVGQDGAMARAEEIYHRLRRAEPLPAIEARWLPDAAPFLKDALEDFTTARPRVWLANKLGVTLETGLRQQADLEDWEDQSARAADRYLSNNNPQRALDLLRERPERSARSPLYALEAETLRFLGRPDEALAVARKGFEALSRAGATDAAAELLLKMAVIEEGRSKLEAARTLLQEAQPIAKRSGDPLLELRVLTSWMRVDRQLEPGNRDARNRLREQATTLLTDDVLYRLRRQPVLLRELAAELSSVNARLAGQAIQTLGLEITTDRQVKLFADALAKLSSTAAAELNPDLKSIAEAASRPELDPEQLRRSVESLSPESLRQVASNIGSPNEQTLKEFREYFRSGVENILRTTLH